MNGFLKYFCVGAILSAVIVAGIDFTISMDKVVIGSKGTLAMRCDVSENDVESIYSIQIRRETTHGSNVFETLVLMELGTVESEAPSLADAINNNKDFVAGGNFDQTTPGNTYLSVSMNISKLACNDVRAYKCDFTYKQSSSDSVITVEANGTFSAYVYPRITQLEGKKNDLLVHGSTSDYQAEFAVGDELELSCTANIGSLPATTIRWRKTSEMGTTDEFIGYQPQAGSVDEGTAISDNQCGYTRTATITYNTTVADANRENNLAFECYVSVSGNPYGKTYTTENNPKFYANVSSGDQVNEGGGDQANEVTRIDFTISMNKVVIGSTGTLTMRCDVTEYDVESIYNIQIRRETTPGSNIFETLVRMERGDAESETPSLDDAINNNKDFVAEGTLDNTTPGNTYLSVSMNISKLVCNDARAYRCDLAYKQTSGSVIIVEANGTFSAYVYPKVTQLEGKKNGFIVQGSSSDNQAEFAVGDELELSCTANIGSLPATTIRWRKTSEMGTTDDFKGYQLQAGSFDEGAAISDNQCGYTRTATITYNTTVADANRENNLAFQCYVSVSGNPYGTTYTTQNNPKFYANVSGSDQVNEGGGDQANEGDGDQANEGGGETTDDKGISDNKATTLGLTAGTIGGVITAVVIIAIGMLSL